MPPRPRSPKSRGRVVRRPRVAGLTPVTHRPDAEERRGPRLDEPARPALFADDPLAEPAETTEAPPEDPARPAVETPAGTPEPTDEADAGDDRDEPAAADEQADSGEDAEVEDRRPEDPADEDDEERAAPATAPAPASSTPAASVRPSPTPRPTPAPPEERASDPAEASRTEAIPIIDALLLDAVVRDSAALREAARDTATQHEPAQERPAQEKPGPRTSPPNGRARERPDPDASVDTAVLDLRELRAEPAGRPAQDDELDQLGAAEPEADQEVEREEQPTRAEPRTRAPLAELPKRVAVLAATFVVLMAAAVTFGLLDGRLHGTPTASNLALVDVAGTAEAAGQLSDAIETVYSFDYTRLDENERAARDVITPEFAAEFDRLFAEVRQRAPEQQAVVSATVTLSAVKELTADHAVLVAFVDQQATRAAADADSRQLAAAGRLTVTGEKVDGRWKIAAVVPR